MCNRKLTISRLREMEDGLLFVGVGCWRGKGRMSSAGWERS